MTEVTTRTEPDIALAADVLILGGGPSGAWAALTAAKNGAKVVLAEKGFVGTGGATAAGNTTMIHAAPHSDARDAAIKRRLSVAHGLADRATIERIIDQSFDRLNALADWGYPYPVTETGESYRGSLRGPDYLRFMRRRLRKAGVVILDQSPALELLVSDGAISGAAGINRLTQQRWSVRSAAVVIATGGCAFLSKALGTNGLTGDGLLLSAEAGAEFSGMEFTGQYGLAPAFSSVTKGIMYFWATFTDEDGNVLERTGDRQSVVAKNLLKGPVYAVIDQAAPRIQEGMRRGQPNMFLSFDRKGIDPFKQRFPVTLRYEGSVRGVGGLVVDNRGATTVPGLFAVGDAASRENFVGAVSGGGGPNATWAIASGVWAGQGATTFAGKIGRLHDRRPAGGLGGAGFKPAEKPDPSFKAQEFIEAVQQEILPLDRNFFRTGPGLQASLARLDTAWRSVRAHLSADALPAAEIVRARETAAMLATARWIVASAIARRESRGINRRLDFPNADPLQQRRLLSGGIDRVWVRPDIIVRAIAS
jgi:succinate dehydrogenase/fumarate reductase flavoprotein subunit